MVIPSQLKSSGTPLHNAGVGTGAQYGLTYHAQGETLCVECQGDLELHREGTPERLGTPCTSFLPIFSDLSIVVISYVAGTVHA